MTEPPPSRLKLPLSIERQAVGELGRALAHGEAKIEAKSHVSGTTVTLAVEPTRRPRQRKHYDYQVRLGLETLCAALRIAEEALAVHKERLHGGLKPTSGATTRLTTACHPRLGRRFDPQRHKFLVQPVVHLNVSCVGSMASSDESSGTTQKAH